MGLSRAITTGFIILFIGGCAAFTSNFLQGGTVKPHSYTPLETVVSYKEQGPAPAGVSFHLVRTEHGLAILEKSEEGMHSLMETHWQTEEADHFASWVNNGAAFMFVIPEDRSKKGARYVYPNGTYNIEMANGVQRPVPVRAKEEPDTVLIPQN